MSVKVNIVIKETFKHRLGRHVIPRLPCTRFTFDLLRAELVAFFSRVGWRILPNKWFALRRLKQLQDIYVNVACGPSLDSRFQSVDLFSVSSAGNAIRWDCRRCLPFGENAAKGIMIEHFVEHLEPREELPSLLADCHRVLMPGGVLRIVVPDAEMFLRAYVAGNCEAFSPIGFPPPFPDELPTRLDLVNHVFHQWHEHRWAYDFETLAHRLARAGFEKVIRCKFQESLDPNLAIDRPVHRPYSLYVEAQK